MAKEIIRLVLVTVVLSFLTVDGLIRHRVQLDMTKDCLRVGMLLIETEIRGLPTNDGMSEHGFHVHESGDLSNRCEWMGPHFNPLNATHGSPTAESNTRHFCDLGNVNKVNTTTGGYVKETHKDHLLDLVGPNGIIGRGIVLHAKMDDLGLGGNVGSLTVGNAGARLECCVIEQLQRS